MLTINHIINPVKVTERSDLFVAQPITFESMRVAKEQRSDSVGVSLCTTQYAEDRSIIPQEFIKTKDLKRSMQNIRGRQFERKLPFIKDILKRAYKQSKKGDYIVYSNVDIALQPHFYEWVAGQIKAGKDAFVINRRTISARYTSADQLPEMYLEEGEKHPGYDCFVFKRELYKKMVLGDICVGAVYIGLVLFLNMKLFANNFHEFGEEYLTFHVGNDQVWRNPENDPYASHNKQEFEKIKKKLGRSHKNIAQVIDSAFPDLKQANQ
ncbi:MAG: hypothetical protein ABJM06_04425 [Gilvibacter sp.]